MVGTPEDVARRFEEQARVHQAQNKMLRAQQESINDLKKMITLLLDRQKKSRLQRLRLLPAKARVNRKRKALILRKLRVRTASILNNLNFHPNKEVQKMKTINHSKRVSELEKRLKAIANRINLQEVGVIWSYPAEWDVVPYPPKFKARTLQIFDGKGSLNQHIYYFKSETENIVSNDDILACLFIGTLKGVAFEWLMKLPADSIKNWADLEKLFLVRFFEDEIEVSVPTLLTTRQKKVKSIKNVCGKISKYGAPMFEWHDAIHTDRDMSPQPVNHAASLNGSS